MIPLSIPEFQLITVNWKIVLLIHAAVTAALGLLHVYAGGDLTLKLAYSATALTVFYFIFKVVVEGFTVSRVSDPRARYSSRKIASVLYILLSAASLVVIWVQDPQAVLVSYGIIAAGAAIALQDFFKNFVGGLVILTSGAYHIGDRIEIESKLGDVIDIDLMYTTVLELREWVDGDQATGRLTLIPNGKVIGTMVNNYTKDYGFIWDEITIPVTYESDWRRARDIMLAVAVEATSPHAKEAESELESAMGKYYLTRRMIDPTVNVLLTDNWIKLTVRYITRVRERRETKNKLSEQTLEKFEMEGITIASQTISIVDFPSGKGPIP